MSSKNFIWRFTPSRTDPELLESIFVQREPLLVDVLERIKDSAKSGNKHHMLLIGPRGIGKTHLVALVYSRVREDPELKEAIRIAWLNEDETTTSFVQLLVRIYRALAHDYSGEFSSDWLSELLESPPDEVERQLKHFFVRAFQNKILLILVENLDALFDGLGDMGQKKWRSFMQEHPFTSILATSQQLFHGVQNQNEVFFGFFAPIHLKALNLEDAVQLLSKVAKADGQSDLVTYLATPEGRSRVRAIRHLAGGNHRIFIVLSSFITRDTLDDLVEPFEKMADELTPYYQERLRWLSTQQRQVVELLCSHPSPLSPSGVARQLLAPENSISTQFKRLTELRYVKRSQRGRESLYELTEPLMRLSSEVKERKPLRLLVSFLRVWYQPERLSQMLQTTHSESLRTHLVLAIEETLSSPDPRLTAIQDAVEQARQDGRIDELIQGLEEKVQVTNASKDWEELGLCLLGVRRYEETIVCWDKALTLNPESTMAWIGKGTALSSLGRYEEALPYWDKALALDPESADTWNDKGIVLGNLKRYEKALSCLDKALALDPKSAEAWNNKGVALNHLKHYEKALSCLGKALALDPKSAEAWSNKGIALGNLKRYEKALSCLDKALALDPESADTWNNKGIVLGNLKRYEKALSCLDKALALDPKSAGAWNSKGTTLYRLKRYEKALSCLDKALALDPKSAGAWNSKGVVLDGLKRYEKALACYVEALSIDPNHAPASFNLAEAHFALNRWQDGFSALDKALSLDQTEGFGDTASMLTLIQRSATDEWEPHLTNIVESYASARRLEPLGEGLVQSLTRIDEEMLSEKALYLYRDTWRELGSGHTELEVPLRIFSVGIEYLAKKRDPKVLLDLLESERSILEQVFGLAEESEE